MFDDKSSLVKPRPIWQYIFFGTALRYLQDCRDTNWPLHTDGGVVSNLRWFLDDLEAFDLPVTHAGSGKLHTMLEKLQKDKSERLSDEDAKALGNELDLVRHTLQAESCLSLAFIVTEKRIDAKKLLDDVGSLMAPQVMPELPSIAKLDLQAAGRAIAFELPTAAAFHTLRATEAVLRHLYCCVIVQRRLKNPMWAGMIDQMRKKKTKRPDDALLDVLDRIRVNFRNPTNHPEAIYDIHEAQDLFLACVEAIRRMVTSSLWKTPVEPLT